LFEIFRAVVPSATAKSRKAAETENIRIDENLTPEFLEHTLNLCLTGKWRISQPVSRTLSEKYNLQMQITPRFMPDCQKIDYLCTININK